MKNIKEKKISNIMIDFIVGILLLGFVMGAYNSIKVIIIERRLNDCQKQYRWWEMVREECGYDKKRDQKNDYCRGFGDGYDYYIGIKQSDY